MSCRGEDLILRDFVTWVVGRQMSEQDLLAKQSRAEQDFSRAQRSEVKRIEAVYKMIEVPYSDDRSMSMSGRQG